jgi:hypothetical protein
MSCFARALSLLCLISALAWAPAAEAQSTTKKPTADQIMTGRAVPLDASPQVATVQLTAGTVVTAFATATYADPVLTGELKLRFQGVTLTNPNVADEICYMTLPFAGTTGADCTAKCNTAGNWSQAPFGGAKPTCTSTIATTDAIRVFPKSGVPIPLTNELCLCVLGPTGAWYQATRRLVVAY